MERNCISNDFLWRNMYLSKMKIIINLGDILIGCPRYKHTFYDLQYKEYPEATNQIKNMATPDTVHKMTVKTKPEVCLVT